VNAPVDVRGGIVATITLPSGAPVSIYEPRHPLARDLNARVGDDLLGELIEDREGLELPDLLPALQECRRMVGEILDEEQWWDEPTLGRQFEIVDELGRVVFIIPFGTVTAD
jgi:hypothetical protein